MGNNAGNVVFCHIKRFFFFYFKKKIVKIFEFKDSLRLKRFFE